MACNFYQQVYGILPHIPKGKVATYGQIAALLDSPRAGRMVGWAMHAIDNKGLETMPWQRVINRKGRISTTCKIHPPEEQARLLRKDGVKVMQRGGNYIVDLEKYLWRP